MGDTPEKLAKGAVDTTGKAREQAKRWVEKLTRLGYLADGVVYGIMGMFLFQAARQYDPQEAGGLGDALVALSSQAYGPWLLDSVAVGFIFFGVYVVFLGRYRQFNL